MAWAVQFDGVSGYCELATPTTYHANLPEFYFEVEFIPLGSGIYYFMSGSQPEGGQTYIAANNGGQIRVRYNTSSNQVVLNYTIQQGSDPVTFAIRRSVGGLHEFFLDGSPIGSATLNYNSTAQLASRIGGETNLRSEFDILRMRLWSSAAATGNPIHDHNADASDHSSTVLTDIAGGNNANFENMGVEAWVNLGGGETVTTEIVDSWSVFEAANTGLLDSWSVFATVSTSLTDGWQVYNAVSNALADAWTIQGAVSSFLADEWSVFNSASTELSDSWTIGGATSATLSDSWTVYNITGSALTDEWSLLASVSAPITDGWVIYTTVNTELTDQWDIGGSINAVLTDSWRIGVIVPSRNYTFSLTPRKLSGRLTDREI